METTEHQEWRSRQRLDLGAVIKAGFATGLLFYFMSGGSPWSTAGTMNAVMGRDFAAGFWTLLFWHFALSFLYTLVIGVVIYRLHTAPGVVAGVGVGVVLYGLNYLIYASSGMTIQSPEFRPAFVHLMFALFASLLYKAMSIPRPLAD